MNMNPNGTAQLPPAPVRAGKPSLVGRLLQSTGIAKAVQYVSETVQNVTNESWFSPGQPLRPMGPKQEQARALDYRVGQNTTVPPRNDEFISMWDLYMLAEYHDITRLLIETRKDQIEALGWKIRPREEEENKKLGKAARAAKRKAAEAAITPEQQARIDQTTKFMEKPDGITPFPTWLRMLLEDVLVYDAPSIYINRDDPMETKFEIVSGMTIKRVIDEQGRTPAPPSVAYQQVIKGMPAWNYTRDQLIYQPRNPRPNRIYGMSPVQQIVMTVNIALRKQTSQLEYYTMGNIPDALIGTPESWTPQQIADFQNAWDAIFEGNTAQRRRAKFVPGGTKMEQTKPAVLKDEFDEWLARVCCYAFSIPPTAFVKQVNRATAQTAKEAATEEGLAPLLGYVLRLINMLVQEHLGQYDLEFAWAEDEEEDPEVKVSLLDTQVAKGAITLNEYREAMGREPYGDIGDKPIIFLGGSPVLLEHVVNPPAPGEPGGPPLPLVAPGAGPAGGKAKPGAQGADGAKALPGPSQKLRKVAGLSTLYVHRPLLNADDLIKWAREQGFETTLPPDDMHVTIAFSREPVDWDRITRAPDKVIVSTGSRSIEQFGEAVVLQFGSLQLMNRWQDFKDIGASWDHPSYKSHVTITYNAPEGLDLDEVVPYDGKLVFGPEVYAPVKENWMDDVDEKQLAARAWRSYRQLVIPY